MTVRRVVTGHDAERRSVVVEDAAVEPITSFLVPGLAAHEMGKAEDAPTVPAPPPSPGVTSYYPPVNGTRFQISTVPPGEVALPEGVDVAAEVARLEGLAPGIMAVNEPDDPGMHTTDSVDYVYIASGDGWLELDDGATVELHAGDTVVQQDTRHAWRNHCTEPCVIVGTCLGSRRSG